MPMLLMMFIGSAIMMSTSVAAQGGGGCVGSGKVAEAFKTHITKVVTTQNSTMRSILVDMNITDSLASSVSMVTNDSICIAVAKAWAVEDSVAYDSVKIAVVKIGTDTYVARKRRTTPGGGYEALFVCNEYFIHKGYLTF